MMTTKQTVSFVFLGIALIFGANAMDPDRGGKKESTVSPDRNSTAEGPTEKGRKKSVPGGYGPGADARKAQKAMALANAEFVRRGFLAPAKPPHGSNTLPQSNETAAGALQELHAQSKVPSKDSESIRPITSNADKGEVEDDTKGALLEAEGNQEKEDAADAEAKKEDRAKAEAPPLTEQEATRRKTQENKWSKRLETLRQDADAEARRRDDVKDMTTVVERRGWGWKGRQYTGQWKATADKQKLQDRGVTTKDEAALKHGHGVEEIEETRDRPGMRYEGQFVNGNYQGFGKMTQFEEYNPSNGQIWEGQFSNNELNGEGECHFSNGDWYFGHWKGFDMDGSGVFIFADGRRYEGEMKKDRRCGKGDYWNALGQKETEAWQDTELIWRIKA